VQLPDAGEVNSPSASQIVRRRSPRWSRFFESNRPIRVCRAARELHMESSLLELSASLYAEEDGCDARSL
jgi:hypothetical protein